MKKRYKIILIGFMVLLLVAIRFFEDSLFYDPLIAFFRSDYLLGIIPPMNMAELMIHLSIRYALNSAISLGIIYIAFQNKSMLKFSVILYALLYLGAVSAFIFLVLNIEREHYLALFYVRRFLIHPLFLLILLPAFYYYRISKRT
ncbi:exosortase F system-associated membrane protein [Christiangramia sp. OXR-203]|jgi:exosortase F-associated protein|uniref:exosortase F system-associated membrane protein n=1 Tax=Christiangramia sp. OXR-203 TaxID=3100176 RepID=UPI002AC94D2C|nr:exosortase F system-associated protein [Christiangramia sp. OXR-203]WPY99053.1 exosortase F system-associated protein [Christiangramia sp. OXR-203]